MFIHLEVTDPAHKDHLAESYGSYSLNIFMRGYPYTVGYIKHDVAAGTWMPWNLSYRPWGTPHHPSMETFGTLDEALASAQQFFEAAFARVVALTVPVIEHLEANLSEIENYEFGDWTQQPIAMNLIFPKEDLLHVQVFVPVEVALTALDRLYDDMRVIPTIAGRVCNEREPHRLGFTKWTIPLPGAGYHLNGVRSLYGLDERHKRLRALSEKAA